MTTPKDPPRVILSDEAIEELDAMGPEARAQIIRELTDPEFAKRLVDSTQALREADAEEVSFTLPDGRRFDVSPADTERGRPFRDFPRAQQVKMVAAIKTFTDHCSDCERCQAAAPHEPIMRRLAAMHPDKAGWLHEAIARASDEVKPFCRVGRRLRRKMPSIRWGRGAGV